MGFHAGRASMSQVSRCSRILAGDVPNSSASTVITVSQFVGSPSGASGMKPMPGNRVNASR